MKRLTKTNKLAFLILLLFGFYSVVEAQCPISATNVTACRKTGIRFSIAVPPSSYYSILWIFGDGTSSTPMSSSVWHLYDTFGVFKVSVTTYNANMTIKCTDTLAVTIYDDPSASIVLPNSTTECYKGNLFCFKSNSKPGKYTGAPIVTTYWDFGDGNFSSQVNPCYNYKASGIYSIYLMVKDGNGCIDTAQKTASIVVLPDLKPNFTTTLKITCPTTSVTFSNKTDTFNKCIAKFYWDFGDGTGDSSQKNWTGFKHIYSKDGSFTPKLYVKSCYGCIDSFRLPSGARNIYYYFDISRAPSYPSICWGGNNVCFSQTPRKLAYYWLWTFNDPNAPPPEQTNDKTWTACHHFSAPGKYDINLKIWEPNCIRDTTICIFTPFKGPMAMIILPPPPAFPLNNCLRGKPVSIYDFAWINSLCDFPVDDNGNKIMSVQYDTMYKVSKYISGTKPYYCNSPVILIDTIFTPGSCPGLSPSIKRINYHLDTASINNEPIYDSIRFGLTKTWIKGDPLPPKIKGTKYYYAPTGYPCFDQTMNENEMYKYNCKGPNLVRYTNNSMKYRLRYDIDNDPTANAGLAPNSPWGTPPALQEYDRCFNKSYPWASDSMQYFWDFGDSYGKNCTSTKAKPDLGCRFSTEVQPWHLFSKSGCFTSSLKVTDTVTHCSDQTSVQIIMEPPMASWEPKVLNALKVSRLDWQIQNTLSPSLGLRGLVVNGTPCVGLNYDQTLDMNETKPTCGRQSWWVLFDSASDCTSKCRDTVLIDLDSNGTLDKFITSTVKCNWIDQMTWAMMGSKYNYSKGGCKTVGFIVKTGDCVDTFFYHNYKYIADLQASFNMLDPDSFNVKKGIYTSTINYKHQEYYRTCPPFQAIMTVKDTSQIGITYFHWEVNKYFGAAWTKNVHLTDSCKRVRDISYLLCHQDSFILDPYTHQIIYTYCFMYPGYSANCYLNTPGSTTLDTFLKRRFFKKQTYYTLDLKDTVLMMDSLGNSMWQPGKYSVTSTIANVYGCGQIGVSMSNTSDFFVGHYTDFSADNQVICYKNGINKVVFKGKARYFQPKFSPTDPDLNPIPYWEDPLGYRNGIPPVAPSVPEKMEWDLDGDGIYETPGIIGTDSVVHVYNKPSDFIIRMRTTDSNNCTLVTERKAFIKVIGAVASFDTTGGISACAPQTVKFVDKSYGLNLWKYTYYSSGQKKDSIRVDSIKSWDWDFGDNMGTKSISKLQNPIHTYTKNGHFSVRLIVKMNTGCTDTVVKKDFIKIEGPEPYIRLMNDSFGCRIFNYAVKDSSKNVTLWKFIRGDGKSVSYKTRPPDSIFMFAYDSVGVFYLFLMASDSVWDNTNGKWVLCTSIFGNPSNPDDPHFRVKVLRLTHSAFTPFDTIIYKGSKVEFTPRCDTEYKTNYWEFGESNLLDTIKTVLLPANQKALHIYELPSGTHDTIYKTRMTAQGAYCPDGTKFGKVRVIDSTVIGIPDVLFPVMNLNVYPNPVTDKLMISGKTFGNLVLSIKIYNTAGELVCTRNCVNKTFINEVFDMKHLPAGIYYIETESGERKDMVKILKE